MRRAWRAALRVFPSRTNTAHLFVPPTVRRLACTSGIACSGQSLRRHSTASVQIAQPAHEPNSQWSRDSRHLLRAILRECAQLPDPYACHYISQHVLSRFRAYNSFKAWKHRDHTEFYTRLRKKHAEARSVCRQLQKANAGERKALLKVLLMTYGRTGKRRYELMLPLVSSARSDNGTAPGSTDQETPDHAQPRDNSSVRGPRDNQPGPSVLLTPQLYALVKSQISASIYDLTRPSLRTLKPDIPKLNSKFKPLAACRVKNLSEKWYATVLDRVLPPLPPEEWHRLRQLARGVNVYYPLQRQRKENARSSMQSNLSALEMVVLSGKGKVTGTQMSRARQHTLTPRFMQRLWAQVFSQCPLMLWDADKNGWTVTWGHHALHSTTYDVHPYAPEHQQPSPADPTGIGNTEGLSV